MLDGSLYRRLHVILYEEPAFVTLINQKLPCLIKSLLHIIMLLQPSFQLTFFLPQAYYLLSQNVILFFMISGKLSNLFDTNDHLLISLHLNKPLLQLFLDFSIFFIHIQKDLLVFGP